MTELKHPWTWLASLMKRRPPTIVPLVVMALLSPAVSPASAGIPAPLTPQGCAATLDCTAAEFDLMPVLDRLAFVRDMEAGAAQRILPGFDRWRNIEGVLEFFIANDWGEPGTWVSTVDASILEGTERGLAIALGRGTDTFGNPGAALWDTYLIELRDGQLTERSVHDKAWGEAEQASTDWGTTVAADLGRQPTAVQSEWYQYTQLYRFLLTHRPAALDEISLLASPIVPAMANFKIPFYDWVTDVRTDVPARDGAEAFLQLIELHLIGAGESTPALSASYVPVMFAEFTTETGL